MTRLGTRGPASVVAALAAISLVIAGHGSVAAAQQPGSKVPPPTASAAASAEQLLLAATVFRLATPARSS